MPSVAGECQTWLALLPASVSPCAAWIIAQPPLLGKRIVMAEVPAAQLEVEKVRHESSLGNGGRNR